MKLLKYFVFAFVFATSVGSPALPSLSPVSQGRGNVTGAIMDSHGAVILTPQPIIIFKGEQEIRKVTPDKDGAYQISLKAGIYRVSVEIDGYYPYRRAAFQVRPGENILLNFVPYPRYSVRGTTVSETESADVIAPLPKYEVLPANRTIIAPLKPLMKFEKKRKLDGVTEYKSAVLTYEAIAVYASRILFNRKTMRAEASGEHVVVEDGKQRIEGKNAVLTFNRTELTIDINVDR